MERSTIKYRPLLTVQFLLHAHLGSATTRYENMTEDQKQQQLRQYNVREWVDIQPTPACTDVLKRYNLLFRATPTGFFVGARTGNEVTQGTVVRVKPYRLPDASTALDFGFRFNDGDSAQTALPIAVKEDGKRTAYFFSNELAHTSGSTLPTLCLPLKTYSGTVRYFKGDLIQKDGSRFICRTAERAGILNILPNNLTHWQVIDGSVAFASMAHRVKTEDKGIPGALDGLIRIIGGETFSNYSLTETAFLRSPDFTIDLRGF